MSDLAVLIVTILLVVLSLVLVAAEYGLVSARKGKLEALAKRGSRPAKRLLRHLEKKGPLVAAAQIGITFIGIGLGSVTEPTVTERLSALLPGATGHAVGLFVSYFLITYVLVVVGELVPKYLAIQHPERLALALVPLLAGLAAAIKPLVWLFERSAGGVLRLFRVDMSGSHEPAMARDELLMMLRSGADGLEHADVVTKALQLDNLDAKDIMVHRLDVKFLDLETPYEQLKGRVAKLGHTRLPVARGDLDDLAGIVYLQDLVKTWDQHDFELAKILRPVVVIPENLTLDRIVNRMREDRTQILVVVDEYGGTSGLITLEDVVEELFGELEDHLEAERPPIEVFKSGRVSARADVRFDELLDFLEIGHLESHTDTLAQIVQEGLERVPKIGDMVESTIGKLRVENMARRRITRVSIRLSDSLRAPQDSSS